MNDAKETTTTTEEEELPVLTDEEIDRHLEHMAFMQSLYEMARGVEATATRELKAKPKDIEWESRRSKAEHTANELFQVLGLMGYQAREYMKVTYGLDLLLFDYKPKQND